jgi:hypothetical protein
LRAPPAFRYGRAALRAGKASRVDAAIPRVSSRGAIQWATGADEPVPEYRAPREWVQGVLDDVIGGFPAATEVIAAFLQRYDQTATLAPLADGGQLERDVFKLAVLTLIDQLCGATRSAWSACFTGSPRKSAPAFSRSRHGWRGRSRRRRSARTSVRSSSRTADFNTRPRSLSTPAQAEHPPWAERRHSDANASGIRSFSGACDSKFRPQTHSTRYPDPPHPGREPLL